MWVNFNMTEEILDIVDEHDNIVGKAPYEQVHAEKLLHHVVFALIFNDAGEILLQLRAKTKNAYPSHWSFSMGGHVRHSESYLQGLVREAKEEVGVDFSEHDFVFKGKGILTESTGGSIVYQLYEVHYDGPIEEKTEEVDAVQFVDFSTLKKMLDEGKEKMHPQTVKAFKRFYAKELASSV